MSYQRKSKKNLRFRQTVPSGATTHALEKCCIKGCANDQEPIYCYPMHCGPSLTLLFMGTPLTPSQHDTQHVAAIPIKPWAVSL